MSEEIRASKGTCLNIAERRKTIRNTNPEKLHRPQFVPAAETFPRPPALIEFQLRFSRCRRGRSRLDVSDEPAPSL